MVSAEPPPLCRSRSGEGHVCMRTAEHASEQHAALEPGGVLVTWTDDDPRPRR